MITTAVHDCSHTEKGSGGHPVGGNSHTCTNPGNGTSSGIIIRRTLGLVHKPDPQKQQNTGSKNNGRYQFKTTFELDSCKGRGSNKHHDR